MSVNELDYWIGLGLDWTIDDYLIYVWNDFHRVS